MDGCKSCKTLSRILGVDLEYVTQDWVTIRGWNSLAHDLCCRGPGVASEGVGLDIYESSSHQDYEQPDSTNW